MWIWEALEACLFSPWFICGYGSLPSQAEICLWQEIPPWTRYMRVEKSGRISKPAPSSLLCRCQVRASSKRHIAECLRSSFYLFQLPIDFTTQTVYVVNNCLTAVLDFLLPWSMLLVFCVFFSPPLCFITHWFNLRFTTFLCLFLFPLILKFSFTQKKKRNCKCS